MQPTCANHVFNRSMSASHLLRSQKHCNAVWHQQKGRGKTGNCVSEMHEVKKAREVVLKRVNQLLKETEWRCRVGAERTPSREQGDLCKLSILSDTLICLLRTVLLWQIESPSSSASGSSGLQVAFEKPIGRLQKQSSSFAVAPSGIQSCPLWTCWISPAIMDPPAHEPQTGQISFIKPSQGFIQIEL